MDASPEASGDDDDDNDDAGALCVFYTKGCEPRGHLFSQAESTVGTDEGTACGARVLRHQAVSSPSFGRVPHDKAATTRCMVDRASATVNCDWHSTGAPRGTDAGPADAGPEGAPAAASIPQVDGAWDSSPCSSDAEGFDMAVAHRGWGSHHEVKRPLPDYCPLPDY